MTNTTQRNLSPGSLSLNPQLRLSYPSPEEDRAASLLQRFPGLPLVVVDEKLQVVFGECIHHHALTRGIESIPVIQGNFPIPEALFLGFNLLKAMFPVNLYEKIHFAHLALKHAPIEEIRNATGIDLPLNAEFIAHLPILIQENFMPVLREGHISLKTALEICELSPQNRPPLFNLFRETHFSVSQGFRAVEMLREIMNRDDVSAIQILNDCNLPRMKETDRPAQAIISALHAIRFPLSLEAEKNWQRELAELGIPREIQVTHAPFFEKKEIEIHWKLQGIESLRHLAGQIHWEKKKS